MSAWAKPGVKCICINDAPGDCEDGNERPLLRAIYTIRVVELWAFSAPAVIVEGPNVDWRKYKDNGWYIRLDRFRPLVTRTQEQDVAQFLPLLAPSLEPVA